MSSNTSMVAELNYRLNRNIMFVVLGFSTVFALRASGQTTASAPLPQKKVSASSTTTSTTTTRTTTSSSVSSSTSTTSSSTSSTTTSSSSSTTTTVTSTTTSTTRPPVRKKSEAKKENQGAEEKRMGIGLEVGGVPVLLLSDIANQAFGMGVGHLLGASFNYKQNPSIAWKARFEHVVLREESMSRTDMDHFLEGRYLKAMTQEYSLLGVGAEFLESGAGTQPFYEALFGYAFGVSGSVETQSKSGGTLVQGTTVPLRSFFYLSGGLGVKRSFSEVLWGVASLRTFFVLNTTYQGALADRTYIPVPLILSVGCEYRF